MTERPGTIADAPGALTPEWLTAALRFSGVVVDETVTEVRTATLGTGQMSDSVRVSLTYDRDAGAPPTLVAKLPSTDPGTRASALSLRNYEKEVRFYRTLAPTLGVRVPRVYYADLAVTPDRFVLLLEDLTPARAGDQIEGCSVEVAEAAVGELVGLHAPRWADPTLEGLDWLDDTTRSEGAGPLLAMLWTGFCDRYAARLTTEIVTAGTQLFDHIGGLLAPRGPRTLVHGDYRLDNLLIDAATGTITVVDWQTTALGSAPYDVAYFIGAGLGLDDRRAHEERLVRDYHERLVGAGVRDYSWNDCWEAYRRGTFTGLFMAVGASMIVERTERGDEMFLTMAERHAHQVLDLDAVTALA